MKNKNLPNKITNLRMIITLIILIILIFPFNMLNINFKKYLIDESIIIDLKMVIVGVLFVISSITDFLDGYLARKYNNVSDYGKLMDPIADKLSINGILIILASLGYINGIIPLITVLRDTVITSFRMIALQNGYVEAAAISGKLKTSFLMIGIALKLFGNLPFGLLNIAMDDFFLIAGTALSFISGVQYVFNYRKYLK